MPPLGRLYRPQLTPCGLWGFVQDFLKPIRLLVQAYGIAPARLGVEPSRFQNRTDLHMSYSTVSVKLCPRNIGGKRGIRTHGGIHLACLANRCNQPALPASRVKDRCIGVRITLRCLTRPKFARSANLRSFAPVAPRPALVPGQATVMERATGFEPAFPAWKAGVLPLDDTRMLLRRTAYRRSV